MEVDNKTEIESTTPKRTSLNLDTQSPGSILTPYSKAIYCDIKSQLGISTKNQNEKKKIVVHLFYYYFTNLFMNIGLDLSIIQILK